MSLNLNSCCSVFISDCKARYLFDQVSFENNIEWLFCPSIRCFRHLEIIRDKLLKLLDRHPNGVTLFVWLGTWQCHTIVLFSSLTSVVRSLPLLLGMSNRLKPYNRLLGQVSDRVPGYSLELLFCSV